MNQHQPFIWKSRLGGAESLGVSNAGQTVIEVDGVSDMAPAYQLHGFMQRGPRRVTMASVYLDASYLSLSQHATLAMELRESESE